MEYSVCTCRCTNESRDPMVLAASIGWVGAGVRGRV
jgi:hypothetical protein